MNRKTLLMIGGSILLGLVTLTASGGAAAAEPPSSFDALRQHVVEMAKAKAAEKPAAVADETKKRIEVKAETVLKAGSAPSAAENPTVAPGKVQWHPTFDAACAAAAKSGKPVLLFQMMGKLDLQFC